MGESNAFSFRFHFVLSKLKVLRDENSTTARIPIHTTLARIALPWNMPIYTHRNQIHVFEIINRRIFVFPGLILKINIVEQLREGVSL